MAIIQFVDKTAPPLLWRGAYKGNWELLKGRHAWCFTKLLLNVSDYTLYILFLCVYDCFWATVCKTVRPMLSDRCPVCLSVTLVYCSQGWIKMQLGTEVGIGPGHIGRWGPIPPRKGHSSPPLFGRCLSWPNGRPSQLLLSSCYVVWQLSMKKAWNDDDDDETNHPTLLIVFLCGSFCASTA